MSFALEFKPKCLRELQQLTKNNPKLRVRIWRELEGLKEQPRPPGSRQLSGTGEGPPIYRVRIGDFRVLYQIEGERLVILVLAIAHRREVYR